MPRPHRHHRLDRRPGAALALAVALALLLAGQASAQTQAVSRLTLMVEDTDFGPDAIVGTHERVNEPTAAVALRLVVRRGGAPIFDQISTGAGRATVETSTVTPSRGDTYELYVGTGSPVVSFPGPGLIACVGATTASVGGLLPEASLSASLAGVPGVITQTGNNAVATFPRAIAAGDAVGVGYALEEPLDGGPSSARVVYGFRRLPIMCPGLEAGAPSPPAPAPPSGLRPGGAAPGGLTPGSVAAGDRSGPVLPRLATRTLTPNRRGVVTLRLGTVGEDVTGSVVLRTDNRIRQAGNRVVTLASTSFSARRGAAAEARMTLPRSRRALLRRLGRVRARALITLRDAAGNATVRSDLLTLRAARR